MKSEVQIELVKLVDGTRLLRLSELKSGLCLEKRLDPKQPVARQKQKWQQAFESMLAHELAAAH